MALGMLALQRFGALVARAIRLGCQRWQSRVADFFCYSWAVFSEINVFD